MNISTVIPCHNSERWIDRTLKSVAAQRLAPDEVIVVLDACTDDSLGVVRASGVACQVLETNCRNGAGARNAGILAATGDWIAFLDADDFWFPEHLSRAAALLHSAQDVGFDCTARTFADGSEHDLREPSLKWDIHAPTSGLTHQTFIELCARQLKFSMSGCVVRRDVLLDVGLLDEEQVRRHDIDMWLRVIAGRTWSFDPHPSVGYRRDTPGSISRSNANAAYYFLRALLKNRAAYASDALNRVIARAARTAIAAALTDGNADDRQRAYQLAWPHLNRRERLMLGAARFCRGLFSHVNRHRRRMIQEKRLSQG